MKRIPTGPVSETLMSALEDADAIEHVLILAYSKGTEKSSTFYSNDMLKLETALYMLEKLKLHLLQ